ncbi:hypothetical protein O7602_06850 [Micromonospora sp. WMMD1128]|uniref:hypothetical protein n=1 Tax=Micromonospora sp. WMMD1128 TaxID=3015150 RepID=UPI00248AFBFB|nr:hypothetical protein [Micromonospora sp. WMMD1128]WBB75236.1 hypothetical protein O7602_06850 [Micromonospora sp. WMMD1128]
MSDRELYCDSCEGVVLFETPFCGDGHGADCPELVCTGCGAAMLVAMIAFRPARRRAPRPSHRHAA